MSPSNRIALVVALSTVTLAPAARAQTRVVTAATPLTSATIGHKVFPSPYALTDLGPIARDAPLGCYSDLGVYYGTRNASGYDRAFVGSNPSYRSDLYYYTNSPGDAVVAGCNASYTAVGAYLDEAVVWDAALKHLEVLTLPSAYPQSYAADVNAHRQIVGNAMLDWDGVLTQHPVLWNTSVAFSAATNENEPTETLVFLPYPGVSSYANAINDQGEIVGALVTSSPGAPDQKIPNALYWDNDANHTMMSLLPYVSQSQATDINNNGVVAGWLYDDGQSLFRAFTMYPGQTPRELPPASSVGDPTTTHSMADALNDAGVVIGRSKTGTTVVATVWINGVAHTLNSGLPFGTQPALTEATSINGAGDIVAGGIASDGLRHAYLLTPNAGGVWPVTL
jgi:uncharacterized membrane protein